MLYYLRNQILGIVDDNHGLQTELPDKYEGKVFLFGTQPQEVDLSKALRIPTWQEAYQIVKEHNPLQQ